MALIGSQRKGFILMEALVSMVVVLGTLLISWQSIESVSQRNWSDEHAINVIKEKYYKERKAWLTGTDLR